jgi:hypothetical protein
MAAEPLSTHECRRRDGGGDGDAGGVPLGLGAAAGRCVEQRAKAAESRTSGGAHRTTVYPSMPSWTLTETDGGGRARAAPWHVHVQHVQSVAYPPVWGGGVDIAGGADDSFTKLNVWALHQLLKHAVYLDADTLVITPEVDRLLYQPGIFR